MSTGRQGGEAVGGRCTYNIVQYILPGSLVKGGMIIPVDRRERAHSIGVSRLNLIALVCLSVKTETYGLTQAVSNTSAKFVVILCLSVIATPGVRPKVLAPFVDWGHLKEEQRRRVCDDSTLEAF